MDAAGDAAGLRTRVTALVRNIPLNSMILRYLSELPQGRLDLRLVQTPAGARHALREPTDVLLLADHGRLDDNGLWYAGSANDPMLASASMPRPLPGGLVILHACRVQHVDLRSAIAPDSFAFYGSEYDDKGWGFTAQDRRIGLYLTNLAFGPTERDASELAHSFWNVNANMDSDEVGDPLRHWPTGARP